MFAKSYDRPVALKIVSLFLTVTFILTGIPLGYASTDTLRTPAAKQERLTVKSLSQALAEARKLEARRINDLVSVVRDKGIDSGICVVDWNVPRKGVNIENTQRIDQSADTIVSTLNEAGVKYLYIITHSGRPKNIGYEEEYSLKPIVDEARILLLEKGLKDFEIVLLPYDLAEAEKVIQSYKKNVNNVRVIFVAENIRFYPEEQLKAEKTASDKEKADIVSRRKAFEERLISLTGRQSDKLVYIVEAFDKAHRGEEASMEMAWLIPEENRAAGIKFAEDTQAVLDFQGQISGSLNTMAGGAKFDKYKQFGDLADAIAKSNGKLMLVGAQVNPYLKAQGKETGKSLLPKSSEQKDVDSGLEKIRKSGAQVLVPSDFVVAGKESSVKLEELTLDDAQIDIGEQSIKDIVAYIDSLKKGDGLILNGGAGVFDKSREQGGSNKGTIELILAANEAAKRGVAVFFAGGDMNNAVKMVLDEVKGLKLDPGIRSSTGGGSLLTALAKGVANLAPVRSVLKMDVEQSLALLYNVNKEAFSEAIILPTFSTFSEDTSVSASDSNRQAALDLLKGKGIYIAVPDGSFADRSSLFYDYVIMPVAVLSENLPAELKEKLSGAKDEKSVTALVQEYMGSYLKDLGVNTAEKQERSHKLDVGRLGALAVDLPSLIAIKTDNNDIFIHMPVWVKRDHRAIEAFNGRVQTELEKQAPMLAKAYMTPLAWPNETPDISTPQAALNTLAKYAPLFFAELSKGDLAHAGLLAAAVNNIEPQAMVDTEGIKYDNLLGIFTSAKDQDAKVPGFGKTVEQFLAGINNAQQLSLLLYLLSTPTVDPAEHSAVAVNNKGLQDAVIGFYGRMYSYLLNSAQKDFNDPRVFEPLRAEIGSYAQKLNRVLRNGDAIEINGSSAESVSRHLAAKGVALSQAEKDTLNRVYSRYAGSGGVFAYDVLQMAGLLSEDNFAAAFRNIKVDAAKRVLPSDKPYMACDGTGRIGRLAMALRLASDINAKEAGYIGRYLVRSRALKGATADEKFASALASTNDMFADQVIRDSWLEVKTKDNASIPMTDLIEARRIVFEADGNVLAAQMDFKTTADIPSVYPVNILLDNEKVGVVYFADITQFNSGLSEELKKQNIVLDNMPRPAIVREEDGRQYYFGMLIDATPGGVEMGDQALVKAASEGKLKLEGPTVWEMAAKGNLGYADEKMGDAAEELVRLREILGNIQDSRLSGNEPFIYLKAQIAKKLLLPMGGGIHFMGRYLQKLPFVKESGAMYFTPTSCSTNGASYITMALSTLFGGFGKNKLTVLGTTFHMYTGGDKKGVMGHFNPKSTGAAKGVKQNLAVNALFTALRTPTAYVDGSIDIVGGSIFDFLVELPSDVPQDLVRSYLARVGSEFPEVLRLFSEQDKFEDGRYRWQDTITGLRTGSIIYEDFVNQVVGNIYRMEVGYDNEMSYSFKMNEFENQLMLVRNRQKDIAATVEAASSDEAVKPKVLDRPVRFGEAQAFIRPEDQAKGKPSAQFSMGERSSGEDMDIAGIMSQAEMARSMQAAEDTVYKGTSERYNNFIVTAKSFTDDVNHNKGAVVVGANAILENAGALTSLKMLADAGACKVVLWAKDKEAADALKAIGADRLAGIIQEGLDETITHVIVDLHKENMLASYEDIALVVAEKDMEGANLNPSTKKYLKISGLKAAKTGNSRLVNSMPLVFARAFASIADTAEVAESFRQMTAAYHRSGQISADNAMLLNDLTSQMTDIPAILATEEVARAQVAYEETIGKI